MDEWEKAFGKEPEVGYIFNNIEVILCDTWFKGFVIKWSAQGIGFGELFFGCGTIEKHKDTGQYGFCSDVEQMSKEFVEALLKEASPQIVKAIMENQSTHKREIDE
jgi:hypothetical protein